MTPSEVKKFREGKKWTQLKLSEKLGCSKRTVEGWENGIIKNFSNMGQKAWNELLKGELENE